MKILCSRCREEVEKGRKCPSCGYDPAETNQSEEGLSRKEPCPQCDFLYDGIRCEECGYEYKG